MHGRLTIEDYRAFITVLEHHSFKRAAEVLFITQSGLSRRIHKLESVLDARLLDRDSRNVAATAVGEAFYPIAQQAVREFKRSQDEIRDVIDLRAGTVTLGSMLTVANHLLANVLAEFSGEHPGVKVRVLDDFGPKILSALESGEAEFAIVQDAPTHPRITFEPLLRDPYVLAMPVGHPLSAQQSVTWREVGDYPCIRLGSWNGNQLRLDGEDVPSRTLSQAPYETQHVSTALSLVAAGVAVAPAPRLAINQGTDGVVVRPLKAPATHRQIGIAQLKSRALSPAATALRGLTVRVLGNASQTGDDDC
jgi:DNA-binding transcriptional LysR family regulator